VRKFTVLFGTRPEAIKLASLIHALSDHPGVEVRICVTGQHREMLDPVMAFFGLAADWDLRAMTPDQTLAGLSAHLLEGIDRVLAEWRPDGVVVQGDTTSTLMGALAAFYLRIPVYHVEAGLRTGDRFSPFPEEVNRRAASVMADWHFAPTERNREALRMEGVPDNRIHVTGNTVVDALLLARERLEPDAEEDGRRMVLITGHRRENFGPGFLRICEAIRALADRFPDVRFVYPVHLNPRVRDPVGRLLSDIPNVELLEPLSYPDFVRLLDRCHLILTDSGGVQEEAPTFGKPALVMRDTTERWEGIHAGTARLVGTDRDHIVTEVARLLTDDAAWHEMSRADNPYGDGQAAARILGHLLEAES